MIPMLAKSCGRDEDVGFYIHSSNFSMAQKLDGERAIVQTKEDTLACWNRSGAVRATEPTVRQAFDGFPAGWTLDGEVVGKIFYPFDLLTIPHNGKAITIERLPSHKRHSLLASVLEKTQSEYLVPVKQYVSVPDKERNFERLLTAGAEGVIFTRLTGSYQQERADTYVKYKFVKDVDCVVIAKGLQGKDNLALGVYDGDTLVEVGHCSALTGDGPKVKVGDVVCVTALYATSNNRLYQPVSPKLRTDKAPTECSIDQLYQIQTQKDQI